MPQLAIIPERDDLPRGGASRSVAALTAAVTMLTVNRAASSGKVAASGAQAGTTVQCLFSIGGQFFELPPNAALWDFTGLTPVIPSMFQKYFLLVNAELQGRVVEAVQAPEPQLVQLTNVAFNPYEAVIDMLNLEPGWACIGGIGIATDTLTTFTPGVDALVSAPPGLEVQIIDGFDGTIMLPVVGTQSPPVLAGF